MVTQPRISVDMQECIDNCEECAGVCLQTMDYCLKQGGAHAAADQIRLLQVCAEICRTSAFFMHAGSDFHPLTCTVCAEVCAACADSCSQFGEDEQMRRCAEVCRMCADSCNAMSGDVIEDAKA